MADSIKDLLINVGDKIIGVAQRGKRTVRQKGSVPKDNPLKFSGVILVESQNIGANLPGAKMIKSKVLSLICDFIFRSVIRDQLFSI